MNVFLELAFAISWNCVKFEGVVCEKLTSMARSSGEKSRWRWRERGAVHSTVYYWWYHSTQEDVGRDPNWQLNDSKIQAPQQLSFGLCRKRPANHSDEVKLCEFKAISQILITETHDCPSFRLLRSQLRRRGGISATSANLTIVKEQKFCSPTRSPSVKS